MKRNISIFSLAMVIFIAVFGFTNIPNNYSTFGPSAFSWFIMLGFYFIPVSLMIAEMSTANSKQDSGISAWIKRSLGSRAAFYGAWAYFIGNIFYLPTLFSRIPVFISWVFASYTYDDILNTENIDTMPGIINATNNKPLFVGLILITVVIITLFSLNYEMIFEKLSKVTGIISLVVSGLFIVLAFGVVLFLKNPTAVELSASSFKPSFNPSVWSSIAWLIFAILGVETIGAFTNQVDNPIKKVPKAIILASVIIVIGYAAGTLALTFIVKPDQLPSGSLEQLLPLMYGRLFDQYGLGTIWLRLTMLGFFILTLVASVLWSLANIKVFLSELPKHMIKEEHLKINKYGTSRIGLLIQSGLIVLFVLIINFGNKVENIYYTIYDMSTMAVVLPFVLLFIAYIMYRVKKIDSPYKMVKNNVLAIVIGSIILAITVFGFITVGWDFSYLNSDSITISDSLDQAILYFGGLGLFLLIGVIWYESRLLYKNK